MVMVSQGEGERRRGGSGCGRTAASLVSCSLTATHKLLTSAVKRRTWTRDRIPLTHLVHTHLAHNLRQELQKRVLRDWRLYDTVSLRLLEVLLSPATSSLRLVHVRAFYRDDLTRLLHRLTGLHHLSIQDPGWALSGLQVSQMASALGRMEHLRVLVLQYCAHDLLLAAVAPHCHHLQVVDVRGSRAVSDGGVWSLVMLPPPWDLTTSNLTTRRKSTGLLTCWGATVKSFTSRMLTLFSNQKTSDHADEDNGTGEEGTQLFNKTSKESKKRKGKRTQEEEEGRHWQDTLILSPCCSFLTSLDIRGTSVTRVGLEVLSHVLPAHAHIAHDPHLL